MLVLQYPGLASTSALESQKYDGQQFLLVAVSLPHSLSAAPFPFPAGRRTEPEPP